MPPLTSPMMMQALDILLYAMLPALGFAAAVMAAVVFLCGKKQGPSAAALGLIAGTVLGLSLRDVMRLTNDGTVAWDALPLKLLQWCLTDLPVMTSGESSWNHLFWAALAAVWAGRMLRNLDVKPTVDWLLRAGLAMVIAWVVIPLNVRQQFDWLAPAFAAVMLAQWVLLDRLATELTDGSVPFCLAVVFLTAGIVLIYAQSQRLMDAAIVLASALTGLAAAAWWSKTDVSGAIPAVAVMLPGLMLVGQQTLSDKIPWYGYALPVVAPLLLVEVLPLKEWQTTWRRWMRLLLMLVLVLIPLAIAIYLADQAAGPLEIPEGALEE